MVGTIKIVSTEVIRQIEAEVSASGFSYEQMMENAGRAVALAAVELLQSINSSEQSLEQVRVTILVGPGNNGGDGITTALSLLRDHQIHARLYLLKPRAEDDSLMAQVKEAGLFIADAENDQRYRLLTNLVASAHLVIDALFGIGIALPLRDDASKVLRAATAALDLRDLEAKSPLFIDPAAPQVSRRTRPFILAVDCPSGLDADTGAIDKNTLHADQTMTFIAAKPGLFVAPGADVIGRLLVSDIGFANASVKSAILQNEPLTLLDGENAAKMLPPRPLFSNKGTFGKVLIIGGSANYTGAVGLAGLSAYRVGAGLVSAAAPEGVVDALSADLLELTWHRLDSDAGMIAPSGAVLIRAIAADYTAVVLGPGIGHSNATGDFIAQLLGSFTGTPQPPEKTPPLVIDADALNLLADMPKWWTNLPPNTVITPHPGEMARLGNTTTETVQADRIGIAREKAVIWNVVLLLKGAHTLIASPDGQIAMLPFKTSALAKAGTGDVLAGMIAGFIAQGVKPFEAACLGGYVHGLAATLSHQDSTTARSILAHEVSARIGMAIDRLRHEQ